MGTELQQTRLVEREFLDHDLFTHTSVGLQVEYGSGQSLPVYVKARLHRREVCSK